MRSATATCTTCSDPASMSVFDDGCQQRHCDDVAFRSGSFVERDAVSRGAEPSASSADTRIDGRLTGAVREEGRLARSNEERRTR
jgi:hypothetical protein